MMTTETQHTFFALDRPPTRRQWVVMTLLAFLTLTASSLLWWNYHSVLALPISKLISIGTIPVLLGVLLAYCSTLTMIALLGLLARPALVGIAVIVLAAIVPIMFFTPLPTTYFGMLVLFLAYYQYYLNVRREAGLRRKFSVTKSIHYGMTGCIALTLVVLSLLFYGTTSREGARPTSSAETIADFTGTAINQFLSVKVPAFNPHESLDDFLYRVLAGYIKNGTLPPPPSNESISFDISNPGSSIEQLVSADLYPFLAQLPADVRQRASVNPDVLRQELARVSNAAFQQQFTALREQFIQQIGIAATGATSMGEVVKMVTGKYLTPKIRPIEHWIPPLLALSLYFLLQIFSFLYIALINLFALVGMAILRSTHLVAVTQKTAEVEEVALRA